MLGNGLLLLFSILVLLLTVLYLKRKWPDIDIIDVYILFVCLYYGAYPLIRSLSLDKGVVYDSYNSNLLAISLVYLQVLLIVVTIRLVSAYLPARIMDYLKIKTLIKQWANVNSVVLIAIYVLLILVQLISYFKYGVRSHILPDDFSKIGKDLPYWLMSVRKIFHYVTLGVSIVLVSKAALSQGRSRYYWLALFILYLPLDAYFGRKGLINVVVMSAVIWLVINQNRLFTLKNVKIAGLVILTFFIGSNLYETYRYDLFAVGMNQRRLANPVSAALDFNKTLYNLKIRPGTWEFNYLIFDKQLKAPSRITTNGAITREDFKNAIPRIFWPEKDFVITPKILAEVYNEKEAAVSLGTNIFGIGQAEFGYYSIIIVPLVMILVIIMMAGVIKMIFNYPVFLWIFSVNILTFFINVEENQNELIFMLRYTLIIMAVFIPYAFISKIGTNMEV